MPLERWNIDVARSTVGFTVRHLVVSRVHGRFTRWSGTFSFDERDVGASSALVTVEVASVETDDAERDAYLRQGDLFDAARFPHMTFRSTSVHGAPGRFKLTGDLTVHGVTRVVVFDVKHSFRRTEGQAARLGFSARGSIRRKDFGMSFGPVLEAGGVAVSEKVEMQLEVLATPATLAG